MSAAAPFAAMPRVDAVWRHPRYQEELARIERLEQEREFCRHGLPHLLDVARLAWIVNLEEGLGLARDCVYAAALLHDIGRGVQAACGVPHDEAGARLAAEILGTVEPDQQFSSKEQEQIVEAVRGHRGHGADTASESALARALVLADHASRACYACAARDACHWSDEEKNLTVRC